MSEFPLGQPVHLSSAFDVAGVPTDPGSLTLTLEAPDGALTTYVWPGGPVGPIVHDSTGRFSAEPTILTAVGTWRYRFTGTPPAEGANEGEFTVYTSIPSGYSYDIATDIGKVRFLIQDHDLSSVAANTPLEQRSAAFTDAELQFLLDEKVDLFYTAAAALRVWANNKQLIVVARKNSMADLDYGTIRRDLLQAAKEYEDSAERAPADAIAEQSWTTFSERRIIWNQWLREMP